MISCFLCNYEAQCLNHLFIHFNIYHDLKSIEKLNCPLEGCLRIFNKVDTYKRHLKQHEFYSNPNMNLKKNNTSHFLQQTTDYEESLNNESIEEQHFSIPLADDLTQIRSNALSMICKWYSDTVIPRNKINILINDVQDFIDLIVSVFSSKINICINKCNDNNVKDELSVILGEMKILSAPFENMKTEYKRFETLEKLDVLIHPKETVIGHRLGDKLVNGRVIVEPTDVKICSISLRDILKKNLEHSNLLDIILKYTENMKSSKLIYNFMQSQLWKEKCANNSNISNKLVFPLFLYFDDFEVNNPLGTHAGSQKLGAIYVSLACLPPELSSSLDQIFLVSLFKTNDKKYFGNSVIFKDLISELNYLENTGISVTHNNKVQQIFFSLGLIIGDNLGLHSVLGFTESFVSRYPCRFCKTIKNECHLQTKEVNGNLRNSINYVNDLEINDVLLTGVKESCVWNEISSFHVTENYCVDIMHDMLEGVCNYDIGLMLKIMIFDFKYFTIDTLNNRIELFDYGSVDIRNRPTLIASETLKGKGNKLKMSASEMLCFVKNLGLIIGDLIPLDSEIWSIYIILDKILNIILSKWIQFEDTILLENLITEHHILYLKIFRVNLKPKHHHMVHYPLIIKKSGPLSLFWAMRFEGKHRELKTTAQSITSRKNIPKTLCLKQQLRLAYRLLSTKTDYYTIHTEIGPIIKLSSIDAELYNTYLGNFDLNIVCCVSWVKIKGILYNTKNMSVIINVCDGNNMLPVFGLIKCIFIKENESFIIYNLFNTIHYDEHFGAFNVILTSELNCVKLNELDNSFPVHHISISNGTIFIKMYA